MLFDDFLPVYDVSDAVATVVHADVATTWDALMEVDLIEVGRKRPLVGVLGAIRTLPDIVSHVVGKFWRPVIEFAKVEMRAISFSTLRACAD